MWLIILSDQLLVIALVSRYLTNKLIRRGPLLGRQVPEGIPTFSYPAMRPGAVFGISPDFSGLSPTQGQIAHALLTRSPLSVPNCCQLGTNRSTCMPNPRRQRSF